MKKILKNIVKRELNLALILLLQEILRRLMGASDGLAITLTEVIVMFAVVVVISVVEILIKNANNNHWHSLNDKKHV